MNIAKTGFFIPLKKLKNSGAFTNFYYNSYKDDFYIFISVRPLKVGPNKSNTSEEVIPKPGPHRSKDCHQSIVSEGVTIGNNGFKDLSSWESIERGLRILEDRPYEPVESQEVTVGPEQASIDGLDPETFRGTARERPYVPTESRDVEETDDTHKNPKGYNALLQFVSLWYIRLEHLGLNLFIINGL